MKLSRPTKRAQPENTIPLINVVFLLLIFFMLAGKLGQRDPFELTPPTSNSEHAPTERPATVYVGPDGRTALGGEVTALEALEAAVRERLDAGSAVVRLKTDEGAEANRVIDVMDALRRAGVERVTVLTTVADDGR
jgi:biopolymer transport protein ExbD